MSKYIDLELPQSSKPSERIEWAGDRYADLCEGLIDTDVGWFVWGAIVGWGDVGTADEKRQYAALAASFEAYLHHVA